MIPYISLFSFNILIAVGIYFSLKIRRSPGIIELALGSLILYSLPLIFNNLTLTNYDLAYKIHPLSYSVMAVPIGLTSLLLAIYSYFPEDKPITINSATNIERYAFFIGFLILTVVLLTNIIDVWPLGGSQSKPEINSKVTNPFSLFLRNFFLSFCMAFAAARKKNITILLLLLYGVIIAAIFQTRSALVFSIIVLVIIYGLNTNISGLKIKLITGLYAIIIFLIAIVYKSIKGRLLQGEIERIDSPFTGNFWLSIFKKFEPQSTISLLNGAIEQNYTPPNGHFTGELLRAIPFSQELTPTRLSGWGEGVQDAIFPSHQHGWASNIWGEIYSLFGFDGLFIWAIVWVTVIILLEKLIRSKNIFSIVWAATLMPQWVFFITRIPFGSNLSYMVNTSLIILCIYFSAYLMDVIMTSFNNRFLTKN